MAQTFQVTCPIERVALPAERQATVSFAVANASATTAGVALSVQLDGAGDAAWFKVENSERSLGPQSTHQVAVAVTVPLDVPAGAIRFHLMAVAAADPDEDWTAGPTVQLDIPEKPNGEVSVFKKYWWAFLIGGLVLVAALAIGLAVGLKKKPALGETCTASGGCRDALVCQAGVCLASEGGACAHDGECTTGLCQAGTCAQPAGLGSSCGGGAPCQSGLVCARGLCLRPAGDACTAHGECETGLCKSGSCQQAALGDPCEPGTTACPTGLSCDPGRALVARNLCRLPEGGTGCGESTHCVTDRCELGVCLSPTALSPCRREFICRSGYRCQDGLCTEQPRCRRDTDCGGIAQQCLDGHCQPGIFIVCSGDRDCTALSATSYCVDGRCKSLPWCDQPADCPDDMRCAADGVCERSRFRPFP